MDDVITCETSPKAYTFAYDDCPEQRTISAVIKCNTGQHVWVQSLGENEISGSDHGNIFSGFLLYKL